MEKMHAAKELAAQLDESTGLSWLWCFLFGPLWFIFIGSWKWAVIAIFAAIVTFGLSVIIMPFFAYVAHRDVAMAQALRLA